MQKRLSPEVIVPQRRHCPKTYALGGAGGFGTATTGGAIDNVMTGGTVTRVGGGSGGSGGGGDGEKTGGAAPRGFFDATVMTNVSVPPKTPPKMKPPRHLANVLDWKTTPQSSALSFPRQKPSQNIAQPNSSTVLRKNRRAAMSPAMAPTSENKIIFSALGIFELSCSSIFQRFDQRDFFLSYEVSERVFRSMASSTKIKLSNASNTIMDRMACTIIVRVSMTVILSRSLASSLERLSIA
jgi:hypothetical protein